MLGAKAREACRFSEEIVPVEVQTRKGTVVVDKDDHFRHATTTEILGKLVARFEKDGTVTAGNASGINDGAAAVVVASAEVARKAGLTPIARWFRVGSAASIRTSWASGRGRRAARRLSAPVSR